MARYLTAFIGAIILFVVICPLTPTPIAVIDGKTPAAHAPVITVSMVAVVLLPRLDAIAWAPAPERATPSVSGSLLDLNCTRLC